MSISRFMQMAAAGNSGGEGWNLATAKYDIDSFNVASEDSTAQALTFNDDGTEMYMIGWSKKSVYQYGLSTPWDITTAGSYVFDLSGQAPSPQGIKFNEDGSKLYIAEQSTNKVYQYDLQRPWNISSAIYNNIYANITDPYDMSFSANGEYMYSLSLSTKTIQQHETTTPWDLSSIKYSSFSIAAQETGPDGIAFKNDGTKMYVVGRDSDQAYQYSLTTPWDTSSVIYDNISVPMRGGTPTDIAFSSDGTKMYISEMFVISSTIYGYVFQYTLSTPWDLSTASYVGVNANLTAQERYIEGISFKDDGTKMYIVGYGNDTVYQYTLSTPWIVSSATYDSVSFSVRTQASSPSDVKFNDDGSKMYITEPNGDKIYQYSLSVPWFVSSASYDDIELSLLGIETNPRGISFKDDGTKMYMVGVISESVHTFTLSTPWDISTSNYDGNFFYAGNESSLPRSFHIRPDGSKLYVLDDVSDAIYQYSLSTPWQISSAVYDSVSFYVGGEETSPQGFEFSADGSQLFLLGTGSDIVFQYTLTTPWDISSMASSSSYSLGAVNPTGIRFKDDGSEMYVLHSGDVNQYRLTTSWDVSTAQPYFFNISSQEGNPNGIAFKDDGTKMYVVGQSSDSVHQYTLNTPWIVPTASYDGISFSMSAQDATVNDITFKDDGTKMYMVGSSTDRAYQYTLSTPWDISTASYDSVSFLVNQDTTPISIKFKDDGTKMYVAGQSADNIHQYTLSTSWDLSTASYDNVLFNTAEQETALSSIAFRDDGSEVYIIGSATDTVYSYNIREPWDISTVLGYSFSVATEETGPTASFFKPDGTKMYVVGTTTDRIHQYSLSVPWEVSTLTYDNVSFLVSGQDTTPRDIHFRSDGTKMYMLGDTNDIIFQYSLSTAWDLSTASYDEISYDLASTGIVVPRSFHFKPDGRQMFVVSSTTDRVHKFDLSTPWDISSAVYNSFVVNSQESLVQGTAFKSDGTKMYIIGASTDRVHQYTLSTPWDITTASYDNISLNISAQETIPQDLTFSDDGTLLHIIGTSTDTVYQYVLSTPWDLSTAYHIPTFAVNTQESAPTSVVFKDDGTKIYVVGRTTDSVYQYTLSVAWDITTASYDNISFSVAAQDATPESISFSDDGTKMTMIGSTSDTAYQYTLSTPWNVATASYAQTFSVAVEETLPKGATFKPDGTRMFVVGSGNIHEYELSTPWKISTSSYVKTVDVSAQETVPNGVAFKPDGSEMYVVGSTSDTIYQYTLTTAWDISTATHYGVSLNVLAQSGSPENIIFNDTGDSMYIVGTNGAMFQYTLTTAWDLSTAYYTRFFSVSAQETVPESVVFKPDGTKMYVIGSTGDDVNEYSLSVPWIVSTASYVQNFSVSGQDTVPTGIAFKDDGSKMYIVGQTSDSVYQYSLSTPWDLSTASYDSVSYSVLRQDSTPESLAFDSTGTNMFVIGSASDAVHQYVLSTPWDISTAEGFSLNVIAQDSGPQGIVFNDDGTKMYMVGSSSDSIHQYSLSTAWKISTASYLQNYSVAGRETVPTGLAFKPDGTKMYVIGSTGDDVNEYNLSIAWDITTATYVQVFSVAAQELVPQGIHFKSDGTRMFTIGLNGDVVNEYVLNTAWDVSSAFYLRNFSISTEEATPTDITFKPDGTKMYVIGSSGDDVNEYSLSTAWDITTATYTQNFSVAAQETAPTGIYFSANGDNMYVIGTTYDTVYQYVLTTPWDISTAVAYSFNVGSQESTPTNITFKHDGTKLYVIGQSSDSVYQYTLGTAWSISTVTYDEISFSVNSQESAPNGISFNDDGSLMYIVGQSSDTVFQYVLKTPWDVSSAFYEKKLTVSSQESTPTGAAFNDDGTKLYIIGYASDNVHQYSLTTPWDLLTASYDSVSFSVASQDNSPQDISFSSDGTKMNIIGSTSDSLYQYTLSTAWDLSTAYYTQSYSVASQEITPTEIAFKPDGTKMYVIGQTGDDINEYDLGTPWKISTASFVRNITVATEETSPTGIAFKPDGTEMYVIGTGQDRVFQYSLDPAWDISSIVYEGKSYSVSSEETAPSSVFFKNDGTKMYVIGSALHQYTLTTAWDVTTAYYTQKVSVSSQETTPTGIVFKPDGTKMYVLGQTGDDINEYDLSIPWKPSTASFIQNFSVAAQETSPSGFVFKDDGTKMYVIGYNNDSIHQYTLSTPWDISTASFDDISFSVAAQDTTPTSIVFKNDGTRMFVSGSGVGSGVNSVHQYDLTTPWDISTASSHSFDISGQDATPVGLAIKYDGTKMYIAGQSTDNVYQYSFGTPWNIQTLSYDGVSFNFLTQETTPEDITFSEDGINMYIIGSGSDKIFQYKLSD